MVLYMTMRIIDGKMDYKVVVTKFPQYKEEIDLILIAEGRHDLIKE